MTGVPSTVVSAAGIAGSGADYRGRDLRGLSFRNQNLDNADFREADLRGADFTGASLRGTDFTGAHLGIRRPIAFLILLTAAAVAAAAGASSAVVAGEFRERFQSSEWEVLASAGVAACIAVAFLALLFWRGPRDALLFLPVAIVAGVVASVIIKNAFGSYDVVFTLSTIGILLVFALAVLAGILGRIVASTFGLLILAALSLAAGVATGLLHGGIAALVLSVFMAVVAKRALRQDERDRPIQRIAYRIFTMRGTRFTGADLTGANFTSTALVHIDTSSALVDDAVWEHGKGPMS
jgi:uncharacterized protein YjbI with pentapeptide repeats